MFRLDDAPQQPRASREFGHVGDHVVLGVTRTDALLMSAIKILAAGTLFAAYDEIEVHEELELIEDNVSWNGSQTLSYASTPRNGQSHKEVVPEQIGLLELLQAGVVERLENPVDVVGPDRR